ncbi:hypothetical protein [Oceanibium sediminis]|uniref:hypothetical protein n=1 Tax=Oceanibium sediminis TaxID=2026339 RepID=UPI0018E51091|nr:hypothetical protein [Oceanibium sediminis]
MKIKSALPGLRGALSVWLRQSPAALSLRLVFALLAFGFAKKALWWSVSGSNR